MKFSLKVMVQSVFLLAFISLLLLGKVQLWMMVFLGSVAAAFFFGRFYCGWLCPINTIIEVMDTSYKSLGITRKPVPKLIKSPFVKYGMLFLFLSTMIFVLKTGHKLPVLPILLALGVVASLIFVPAMWHRYLCPYGTLLSLAGRTSKYGYSVAKKDCIKCGICKGVCPGEAIKMQDNKVFPQINSMLCLQCAECVSACPKQVISYK